MHVLLVATLSAVRPGYAMTPGSVYRYSTLVARGERGEDL